MEKFFSMQKSKLSAISNTFLTAFYKVTRPYLSNPALFFGRFFYAMAIKKKAKVRIGRLQVWGFIDGNIRRICRPTYNQEFRSNMICLCQGNITCNYFRMCTEDLMTVEQYVNLVPIETHIKLANHDDEEEEDVYI
jgi:hypothetical protein